MAGGKRRELTTDDLLRMQEGPNRKRTRYTSDSEEESDPSGKGPENEDSASSASEGESESEIQSESDEMKKAGHEFYSPKSLNQDTSEGSDREDETHFTSSRISTRPKADQLATISATASTTAVSWISLGIIAPLQTALSSMSIRKPTEIQAACIPPLLAGRDCIGNAKTGSGKTIAFALPILQKLAADPYGIFALVLTPTRELAFQIADQFAVLGGAVGVRTAVIVGGMDMISQAIELRARPHVIIATPGRIVDHLRSSSGEWDLSRVKFLVLDEADRLLTPTFAPELAHLFGVLPKERQTCLFTATWTESVEKLAEAPPRPGKQRPFTHKMTASVETVEQLKQFYILVPSHVREAYLFHLLSNPPESTLHLRRAPPESAKALRKGAKPATKKKAKPAVDTEEDIQQPPPTIIFANKPHSAAYLTHLLQTLGIRTAALHSRLTQRERLTSLSLFRAAVVPVLVSTDVGARGLDIADVAMVINWDLPQEPEEYTHRVGRTARAGRGGVAVSLVTERDEERVQKVESRIKTELVEMTLPEEAVLQKLNAVSTAKRLANMELHDTGFGAREARRAKVGAQRVK